MSFPEASRVIYQKNPLDEVICQLRFPSILKIDTEIPSIFQEKVREHFPVYKAKNAIDFPPELPPQLAAIFAKDMGGSSSVHEFHSRDGNWTLALTRDFVALTSRKYEKWEEFSKRLSLGLDALKESYNPAFFTRIGLRYKDLIRRSVLDINDSAWKDLLKPVIAGALSDDSLLSEIEISASQLVIKLPEQDARVQVNHGLVLDDKSKEECYLIDADLYTNQETEFENVFESLTFLNKQSRLFFRWCIEEKLHNAMAPEPIQEN